MEDIRIIACGGGLIPVYCKGCKQIRNLLWKYTDDICDLCGEKWIKLSEVNRITFDVDNVTYTVSEEKFINFLKDNNITGTI